MNGLSKLALAWLFFACGASVSATEIADNLLKLDPLVYFGAESFESDELKGLNRGRANSRLQYLFSGEQPTTQDSFLGAHAGQALHLDGQASLTLSLDFLAAAGEASTSKVMSFSAALAGETGATRQCLLSIGNAMALVLEEGSFRIYTPGTDGPQVEVPDVSGLQENRPLTLVFARNQIELSTGLTPLWKGDFPEGVAGLANDSLTLGNCSAQVKSELLDEEIGGFQGDVDELAVLDAPALPWDEGQASVPAAEAMAKATLIQAALGFYPIEMTAQAQTGLYGLDAEAFALFVFPRPDVLDEIEYAVELCLRAAEPNCDSLYSSHDQGAEEVRIESFHKSEGFEWPSKIRNPKTLELKCFGPEANCEAFRRMTSLGKAFGKPKSLEAQAFTLVRTDLPAHYERSLTQLSLPFSVSLTEAGVGPQPVNEGLVTLFRSDEG